MTVADALSTANNAPHGDRHRRYETICALRGACRREPLLNDPGRWTWCPDCLTLYDDYGDAINQIRQRVAIPLIAG